MTQTVLIVDDNQDSREVIGDILSHHGLRVEMAISAEGALELLTEGRFDLVVIDLRLPGMSGWELVQTIQAQAAIPCVAITAYHNPQVTQEIHAAGFVAYFPKPLDERTFAQELRRFM